MRRYTLFALACALGGTMLMAQQTPLFKTGTQVVALYATVTDAQKRLVPDLMQDDFEILDNDRPQTITLFDNSVRPITVVVMLDTSGSMTVVLDLVKQAAEQFLIRLMPQDKGTVGAFNDRIEFGSEFTSDRDSLVAALRDLDFGNGTKLYDALDLALDRLRGVDGRRVILLLTDGEDTNSKADFGDVLDRARADEVMVYGIGLETEYFNGQHMIRSNPDRALKKLADETGGGYFKLKKTDELNSTFTRVAQELHSQYLLGFTPALLDGKIHKLDVRIKRPGMTARARKSYLAASARATAATKD